MEVSGVVSRQVPCFSATRSSTPSFHGEQLRAIPCRRGFGVSLRAGGSRGSLNSVFCDDGHVTYYQVGPRCGGGGGCKKEKEIKKKLKMIRRLSNDLSASSQIGFGPLDLQEGFAPQVKGTVIISEGAEELLLKQLEQIRAEEKELKRKRKDEKARIKAEKMITMGESESSSSSSSSESSDSECGEVIDMKHRGNEVPVQPVVDSFQPFNYHQEGALLAQLSSVATTTHRENVTVENGVEFRNLERQIAECCNGTSASCSSSVGIRQSDAISSLVVGVSAKRIEVCMGKKCKQSGGGALLEEFERMVGVEASVVGCKCMGKCKNGPNVRVSDGIQSEGVDDSVRTLTNPLYIGVGLEDVSLIVANLIGEDNKDLGLVAAP